MKLELKNIKCFGAMSEETNCYTATVYVDGKASVAVSNRGHGGPDEQRMIGKDHNLDIIDAWCRANLPKRTNPFNDQEYECDLEMWCGDEVDKFLALREMRRRMKAKAVFVDGGKLYTYGYRGRKPYDQALGFEVAKKYPNATLLNTMPEDAALAAYRSVGQ